MMPSVGCYAQLALHALPVLHGQALQKQVRGRVVEHDAHDLVIDHAFYQFGRAAQKRFNVENGAGLAADFIEHQQRVGLAAGPLEKPRIFHGHGQAAGQQHQYFLLLAA